MDQRKNAMNLVKLIRIFGRQYNNYNLLWFDIKLLFNSHD